MQSFREYIETHAVFTTRTLREACGGEPSISNALSRATAAGKVEKVRNGLYVSRTGRFTGMTIDPYRIAATFDDSAIFSYHSALELHGLAHSLSTRIQFRSANPRLTFRYAGNTFERYESERDIMIDTVYAESYGSVQVTTREKTFIDCMSRMRFCGGAEEVLHSLAGLPYLNLETVEDLLLTYPASVTARAGWYLEMNAQRWHVESGLLERLSARLPVKANYYFDSTARKGAQSFNARWKLNFPAPKDEIDSCMEL